MKKTIVLLSVFMIGMNAWAQDSTKAMTSNSVAPNEEPILRSKKGFPVLPEAGDWSVSASTSNLFGYFGNLANTNNNYYNPADIFNGTTISVGYFKTNTFAYNMSVSISSRAELKNNYVTDDLNMSTTDYKQVKDIRQSINNYVSLGFGIEKRFGGQRRIQRFIGAGVGLGWGIANQKIDYANEFTATNQTPTSTLYPTGSFSGFQQAGARVTQENNGSTVSTSLYVNAGAEYFFAPKMSLGLTFSAGPRFSQTFGGFSTIESYSTTINAPIEAKYKTGNTTAMSFFTSTSSIYFRLFF